MCFYVFVKVFPLFTIIRFTNEVCRTSSEEHGICHTKLVITRVVIVLIVVCYCLVSLVSVLLFQNAMRCGWGFGTWKLRTGFR